MAHLWNVISNSEDRLILERGADRLDIEKPEDSFAQEIFLKIVAGSTVSDIGVEILMHPPKKLPKRVEENNLAAIAQKA